eukprot:13915521-Alexandrium_andersonii.AAC.1
MPHRMPSIRGSRGMDLGLGVRARRPRHNRCDARHDARTMPRTMLPTPQGRPRPPTLMGRLRSRFAEPPRHALAIVQGWTRGAELSLIHI